MKLLVVIGILSQLCFCCSAMLTTRLLFKRRTIIPGSTRHVASIHTEPRSTLKQNHERPNFKKEIESKYFDYDRMERELYEWWESSGFFKPRVNSKRKPFIIPMPPPNVTGYLHMGHALFVAIQDILTRFHRMRGRPALWVPGTDHAGIATQLLVERSLQGEVPPVSRKELGRDKFLERVWQWKGEKGGYITQQMRRLGASADWSREKFTLDPDMSEAVTEAFVRLHDQGLVYKGDYLVNWSPNLQTAVSDLEVDYSEEMGTLYTFRYPVADGSGDYLPVATTRPETLLGDTAVCVHPEDERYQRFVGRTVKVPPLLEREVPVIADEVVDRDFGTGCLKITPAHDVNDYETAKRHSLPLINVMNRDASINNVGGPRYEGLDRFEARKRVWSDLESMGLAISTEPHQQRVPRSQRGGEVIEPLVSSQWFVKTQGMASLALKAVQTGDMQILPERFEKVWAGWLDNIRDWCVSRQLWWGHRVPVWYIDGSETEYVVARNETEARAKAELKVGPQRAATFSLRQDEDVLDTWFSSGLWPFATLGWPKSEMDPLHPQAEDYRLFYPATVLETGYDILFFWVARMAMLGLQLTGKSPFQTVYLHGLVRDAEGQKMSKTKGNVIDPIDSISQSGCDALRYTLVTGSTPGQDIPLSTERIEANRNFMNKLWNMGKYIQLTMSQVAIDSEEWVELAQSAPMSIEELNSLPLVERALVHRVHVLASDMTQSLEQFRLGEAGLMAYEYLWNELADWYVEVSKTRMRNEATARQARRVLTYCWNTSLRLLHPFAPFVTETLWQQLPKNSNIKADAIILDSVMLADWPVMQDETTGVDAQLATDAAATRTFDQFQKLIRSIRNLRAEYKVEPGKKLALVIRLCVLSAEGQRLETVLRQETAALSLLGRIDESALHIQALSESLGESPFNAPEGMGQCVQAVVEEGVEAYLPLAGMVDLDKERARLSKQVDKLQKDVDVLRGRLDSPSYVSKAPEAVVVEAKAALRDKQEQLTAVRKSLAELE